MKDTGSGYVRRVGTPNLREQDGDKRSLLCDKCEQRLSASERWFAEEVFHPYLRGTTTFSYDRHLAHFAVSILWRYLLATIDGLRVAAPTWLGNFVAAEGDWRGFLLGSSSLEKFGRIHVLFLDLVDKAPLSLSGINTYFTRMIDGGYAFSTDKAFVYAKFARFLFIGEVAGLASDAFVGMQISVDGGTITARGQELRDRDVGQYLVARAREGVRRFHHGLSNQQRAVIAKNTKRQGDRAITSDLGRALMADGVRAVMRDQLAARKPGRNTPCPCGSGRKYKRCCGWGT